MGGGEAMRIDSHSLGKELGRGDQFEESTCLPVMPMASIGDYENRCLLHYSYHAVHEGADRETSNTGGILGMV